MRESILSDAVTALMLVFCIWFSHQMGEGFWTLACFFLLGSWLTIQLPMETSRVVKLSSKDEAIKWAESLPD